MNKTVSEKFPVFKNIYFYSVPSVAVTEIEASFPYREVHLKKGPISKDIYDVSREELGR